MACKGARAQRRAHLGSLGSLGSGRRMLRLELEVVPGEVVNGRPCRECLTHLLFDADSPAVKAQGLKSCENGQIGQIWNPTIQGTCQPWFAAQMPLRGI